MVWSRFGVSSEWAPLRRVLLHVPGEELGVVDEPEAFQMLARPDVRRARAEHDGLRAGSLA